MPEPLIQSSAVRTGLGEVFSVTLEPPDSRAGAKWLTPSQRNQCVEQTEPGPRLRESCRLLSSLPLTWHSLSEKGMADTKTGRGGREMRGIASYWAMWRAKTFYALSCIISTAAGEEGSAVSPYHTRSFIKHLVRDDCQVLRASHEGS